MAISYSIDQQRGLVLSEFSDTIHVKDFFAYIRDLRHDQTFQPDFVGLYDWQQMDNLSIDYNDMVSITSECPWGEKSYRAIVVSRPFMFGMSRMFQSMSDEVSGTIQIFHEILDAEAWLDAVRKH